MKTIKKNVYYCDFCKKHSLRSLKIHEKHCTANPDRECRLCEGESVRDIIEKYKKMFVVQESNTDEWGLVSIKVIYKKDFTLDDIKNELEYECPNCLLTILRCTGLNRFYFEQKFKFDYQDMLGSWWEAENMAAMEAAERDTYY